MSGTANEPASHRDRSGALVLFGVLEIVLGVITAMVMPLAMAAMKALGMPLDLRSVVPVTVFYEIVAVAFIVLGIGSIRARRWAREIWISLSAIWLLTGVCSLAVSSMLLPTLLGGIGGTANLPAAGTAVVTAVTLVALTTIYVILPGALLLFYRSPQVAATCLANDPGPQWTDRLPQRLVTLVLLWILLAVSVVVMPAYSWVFPFFGFIWTGGVGAAAWMFSAVIFLALALATAKQEIRALWAAMTVTAAAAISTITTFALVDLQDIVAAMQMPADQAAMAAAVTRFDRPAAVVFWCVVWIPFLGYLWSLRSEFQPTEHFDD
jgi:hypothetical protein